MARESSTLGSRLVALRQMEELTQADLAHKLGVTQGFVSRLEKDDKPLPDELAQRAADAFDLPREFFAVCPSVHDAGVPTFRKRAKATARQEAKVVSTFGEAARLFRIASEESGYRTFDVDAAVTDDVEETAANIRSVLGLAPADPLKNATRAAERLGVGVIHNLVPTLGDASDHHGISRPSGTIERPLIATLGSQPGAVARMTVMHELGHLVYDRDLSSPIRGSRAPEELRAFRFAGAMLIPASVIHERISETLTLHGYLRIKADYGISVSALIKRASDLGVISSQRARSLFIQLSSQGWRKSEPVTVGAEKQLLLRQAVEHGISADARVVAERVGISYAQSARWTGLPGAPAPTLAPVVPLRQR